MPSTNQPSKSRLPTRDRSAVPTFLALMLVAACLSGCTRRRDPQAAYNGAWNAFQHGDLSHAQEEAKKGYDDFHGAGPEWAWKFTILRARILYQRGLHREAIKLLSEERTAPPSGDLVIQKYRFEGLAYVSLHLFTEAERRFDNATRICASFDYQGCGRISAARAMLEMERGRYPAAQALFEEALALARKSGDQIWESETLLNLSWAANEQTHFDEALDWAADAGRIAARNGVADIAETAIGNMGWAYYKLGDPEKAERMFVEARNEAAGQGEVASQVGWLTAEGYVHLDARDFAVAELAFRQALKLSQQIAGRGDTINSLIALAFVSEQTNKLDDAKRYADEALSMARADNNGRDIVYPLLVHGRVAARQHDTIAAEKAFHEVADSPDAPVFLKWEAERSLAHLYEDENRSESAHEEYRTALSTFEAARCALHQRVDSRLPFLSNAQRIYEDYVHFLVARGKTGEALQVADYDRGKTLSEGLGTPCKPAFAPEPLNAQDIARRAGGAILFYWLGEKQSYLWAITPRATRLFQLAPSSEIDAAVRSYRTKLEGPPEILEASNDGGTLYHMLVEPAHDLLSKEALAKNDRVFIIPDGSLNSLNFETLVVPEPKHYWIEDVTITSAGSLRLLFASRPAAKQLTGKLLLIGDPVSPTSGTDNPYPELPNAAAEIHSIEQHFAAGRQTVFTREQATPAAHLNGHPEQFSYIHFVAHGTASRTSPLDSAIILSRDPASKAATGEDDSFKLYARDIIQHPLRAELVTITACYGAGRRSYSGEGLVGLSWAFLRAGAHNVVGALWDVSSVSTPQLMDAFYGELQKGKSPSAALRTAKLGLLHSDTAAFRKPFYWAPFQLYTGS